MTPEQHAREILLKALETKTTQEVARDYGIPLFVPVGLKYNQDGFILKPVTVRKILRAQIAIEAAAKRRDIPLSKEEKEAQSYKGNRDSFDRPNKNHRGRWMV